jgi:hypothetical protein
MEDKGFAERAHALSARTTDSREMAIFGPEVKKTGCMEQCMPQEWLTNMVLEQGWRPFMPRAALLALFICVLPGVGLAKPYPAGKCTTLDDGVATTQPPAMGPKPALVVLPDVAAPKKGAPDNAFIADLLLDVRGDGTVAKARALCTNVPDRRYTNALVKKASDWHIGVGKPNRYAYRVVISPRGDTITPAPLPTP